MYSCFVVAVEQDQLKIAEVGDSIDLSCFSTRDMKTTIVWMKQNPGEKPVQIATSYQHQAGTFYNGFDHSGRFKTQAGPGSFNLTISSLEPSDTATYYCANIFIYDITFGEGTVLVVKDASLTKHTVHQLPVFEAVQPGDSVTLQCSVESLTPDCSGDHRVYWFRHGSGESHPGIIYTHGNRSDECEKSSETDSPPQSCVYKLPKRNLSLSDAGTYYCAVAACGQILFGNGTDLNIKGKV
ncbi:immunoglobulin kappa light chain-like [Pygocentrus nattereri]|uniref:immunoglobulin kappa light chain-like n=1 Tax=Pygocentrus nattereri TaxID=42514 RepID=UPI0008143C16|nr:immunoglobulin kappa light chain-like [Pygocentrus nattereri]